MAVCLVAASPAELPISAPPLPAPDPGAYTVVTVSTAQELADACWNLSSNTAISIAPGTYDLGGVSFPNGVDGRLTVGRFGAAPISNVQIRGATGDPNDVVLLGRGMLDPTVPFGIQIFTATDVVIADLSIGAVYYHAVAIQGDQGAQRVRLYHTRLYDAGQQIVKGSGSGADDVTIEYSELFFSSGAVVHPEGSPPNSCYTNAIDALGAARWTVRDSWIHDIRCRNGALAGPAILLWGGSRDTVIERNTITDSSRGISLGLLEGDHQGGVARNNFIRWDPGATYAVDVAIYTTSPGARIEHNTVLTNGTYQPAGSPVAIEVRYGSSTGVEVRGNLLDGAVLPRNGATPLVADNVTSALAAWFADEASGDLHLTSAATPAIDQLPGVAPPADDWDGDPRPLGSGSDIGADELAPALFSDGFESGDLSRWTLRVP